MGADEEREKRLKAQLRLNLRRRKQKARAVPDLENKRTSTHEDAPGKDEGPTDE